MEVGEDVVDSSMVSLFHRTLAQQLPIHKTSPTPDRPLFFHFSPSTNKTMPTEVALADVSRAPRGTCRWRWTGPSCVRASPLIASSSIRERNKGTARCY